MYVLGIPLFSVITTRVSSLSLFLSLSCPPSPFKLFVTIRCISALVIRLCVLEAFGSRLSIVLERCSVLT